MQHPASILRSHAYLLNPSNEEAEESGKGEKVKDKNSHEQEKKVQEGEGGRYCSANPRLEMLGVSLDVSSVLDF